MTAAAAGAHWHCAAVAPAHGHGAASVLHSSTDPHGEARPQLQQQPGVGCPSPRIARAPAAGLPERVPARVRHLNACCSALRESRPTAVAETRGSHGNQPVSWTDHTDRGQGSMGALQRRTPHRQCHHLPISLSSAVRPCLARCAVSVRPVVPSPVPFHLSAALDSQGPKRRRGRTSNGWMACLRIHPPFVSRSLVLFLVRPLPVLLRLGLHSGR
jgi:hypothetical protein